jgi:hypothetical protein
VGNLISGAERKELEIERERQANEKAQKTSIINI